ncbi:uncharacterized protein LOC132563416 [Ylistrum balloti]|uniref:uncharacterized protein LOC132563416 n=1 Tax=Ylistrum balloti TaxID=509963 RepID=UPI002905B1D5|nr:uncharacterized protein LOC132563416 [Ylistrum balloti]
MAHMSLSPQSKVDLEWWVNNVHAALNPISHGTPTVILTSDASKKGRGGALFDNDGKVKLKAGGRWSLEESLDHINYLELKAAWFTCQALCRDLHHVHIRLNIDNTTAIAYISNMGEKTKACNELAVKVWKWAIDRDIWLSAAHIPGRENVEADTESRLEHENTEWRLHTNIFQILVKIWGRLQIDLFASRLNAQLPKYVSWKPDPFACAVDAFTLTWNSYSFIFPPFSLLGKILQKICEDKTQALLIAPMWSTQPWYSHLLNCIIDCFYFTYGQQNPQSSTPRNQGQEQPSKDDINGLSGVRRSLRMLSIPPDVEQIILSSWRPSTVKQYSTFFKKWTTFASSENICAVSPDIRDILSFLTSLYHRGLGYSAINSARSMLSTFVVINGQGCGTHPLIKRFMKVFNLRPALPRNNVSWDPEQVLTFLKTMDCGTLKSLTLKLVTMLALLTGQRLQSLHLLDIKNISLTDSSLKLRFGDALKQTRPGFHQREITLQQFEDKQLCVVSICKDYLTRTEPLTGQHSKLFLGFQKPYKPVSKATLARWIKTTLASAGIDMNIFTPHSTRAASVSAASRLQVPITSILSTAGWSNTSTFAKFYKKLFVDSSTVFKIH